MGAYLNWTPTSPIRPTSLIHTVSRNHATCRIQLGYHLLAEEHARDAPISFELPPVGAPPEVRKEHYVVAAFEPNVAALYVQRDYADKFYSACLQVAIEFAPSVSGSPRVFVQGGHIPTHVRAIIEAVAASGVPLENFAANAVGAIGKIEVEAVTPVPASQCPLERAGFIISSKQPAPAVRLLMEGLAVGDRIVLFDIR